MHRIRRSARPHRAAAQALRGTTRLAVGRRVRRRRRHHQPAARPRIDPAHDLLRLAPRRPGRRDSRRRLFHRARPHRDLGPVGAVSGRPPAALGRRSSRRRRRGRPSGRCPSRPQPRPGQLAPRHRPPGRRPPVHRRPGRRPVVPARPVAGQSSPAAGPVAGQSSTAGPVAGQPSPAAAEAGRPPSIRSRWPAIRWLAFLAAGAVAGGLAGPYLVLVLAFCGSIELLVRTRPARPAQPAKRTHPPQRPAPDRRPGRTPHGRHSPVGRLGSLQGRRPVLRRRLRDHPADAARRRAHLPLDDRLPVPQRRRPRPGNPRPGRPDGLRGRLRGGRPGRRACWPHSSRSSRRSSSC